MARPSLRGGLDSICRLNPVYGRAPRLCLALVAPAVVSLSLMAGVQFSAAPALAQSPGAAGAKVEGRLGEVEREIQKKKAESQRLDDQARKLETDLRNLRQSLVSAAKVVQDRELRVITLEAKIADLVRQENEKLAVLRANRRQLAGVLMALQKMVQFPPEALLALPESPDDLVRSAILLRSVVPEIDRRAASLRLDLEALASTREQTARERVTLTSVTQDLDRRRGEIRRLMANKRQLLDRTRAERRQAAEKVARLAAKAKDLKGLMARLEEQRLLAVREAAEKARRERAKAAVTAPDKPATKVAVRPRIPRDPATVSPSGSITKHRGKLPRPVVGDLIGRYGQNMSAGLSRKGIDIAARSGAQVIANFGGIVAFAGKFRGYGQLLIIDHGDGYHTLLAGMARIDAAVGQVVSTGEPVGQMPVESGGRAERPVLYVELRRRGQPINPLPWLAAGNNKVSG